jgi:hypothetical protein
MAAVSPAAAAARARGARSRARRSEPRRSEPGDRGAHADVAAGDVGLAVAVVVVAVEADADPTLNVEGEAAAAQDLDRAADQDRADHLGLGLALETGDLVAQPGLGAADAGGEGEDRRRPPLHAGGHDVVGERPVVLRMEHREDVDVGAPRRREEVVGVQVDATGLGHAIAEVAVLVLAVDLATVDPEAELPADAGRRRRWSAGALGGGGGGEGGQGEGGAGEGAKHDGGVSQGPGQPGGVEGSPPRGLAARDHTRAGS